VPPDGESYAMLTDRVAGFLATLRRKTVLVSHGGVARALMTLLGGVTPRQAAVAEITQGKVLVFEAGSCSWVGSSSHIDE
jgi:broad specificity phosphatase PhoE